MIGEKTSIQDGVYEPGGSDLFIKDGELLKIKLCHEADIYITTGKASIEDPKPGGVHSFV